MCNAYSHWCCYSLAHCCCTVHHTTPHLLTITDRLLKVAEDSYEVLQKINEAVVDTSGRPYVQPLEIFQLTASLTLPQYTPQIGAT